MARMAESSQVPLLLNQLSDTAREICGFPECQNKSWKRLYDNLLSKVELCRTLFEELKNIQMVLDEDSAKVATVSLKKVQKALKFAKELLQSVNGGSKIYKAQHPEMVARDFHFVTELIEKALNKISYDRVLSVSEEVQEQIEQVQERIMFSPDQQLQTDLLSARQEIDPDPSVLRRLSDKLQLRTINDLKKESLALHGLLLSWEGININRDDWFVEVSLLLKRLKTVLTENPTTDISETDQRFLEHSSPVIPYEYMCPISHELMEDPVIVSTGQTYERSQIQKWMDGGSNYCPMTRQTLSQEALIPNHVVKTGISKWSEYNNQQASDALLQKLATGNPEEQRTEAILWLFELLSSTNHLSQSHALKTLRNLSAIGNPLQ